MHHTIARRASNKPPAAQQRAAVPRACAMEEEVPDVQSRIAHPADRSAAMSQHLSRRRLIAGGLAGAGLAAVPVLGASEALATAICDTPLEVGAWRNVDAYSVEQPYHVTRLELRFVCGTPAPKSLDRGEWYLTVWLRATPRDVGRSGTVHWDRTRGTVHWDRTVGEIRARRFANDRRIVASFEDGDASFRISVRLSAPHAGGPACGDILYTTLVPLRFGHVRGTGAQITHTLRRSSCLGLWDRPEPKVPR
jgi:hypothetical protein